MNGRAQQKQLAPAERADSASPASTQILIRLKPNAVQQARLTGKAGNVIADLQNLSVAFQDLAARWQVISFRLLVSHQFGDPELAARVGLDRLFVIEVPAGTDALTMAGDFASLTDEVEMAGPDAVGGPAAAELISQGEGGWAAGAPFSPNDPAFPLQWGMHNTGQAILGQPGIPDADIDAPEAWAIHTGDFGTVTIAFLDSGISSHVELGSNQPPYPNGRILHGFNTVLESDAPEHLDDECGSSGFGTGLAGSAAAEGNNNDGIAGVSWGTYVLPVRVLTGCNGFATNLIEGIVWAADHDADIINMGLQYSLSSPETIQMLQDAVDYAHGRGALLIAAVGQSFASCGAGQVCYPARCANVLGVSNTKNNDEFDSNSRFGPDVDLCAPGRNIYTLTSFGDYHFASGTGDASAFVSGVAALIKFHDPHLSNVQIAEILQNSADDLGDPGWDDHFGHGRVNAQSAILGLSGACCRHDTGNCEQTLALECQCDQCDWRGGVSCGEFDCEVDAIPTASAWGLAILTVSLLIASKLRFGFALPKVA